MYSDKGNYIKGTEEYFEKGIKVSTAKEQGSRQQIRSFLRKEVTTGLEQTQ